MAGSGLPTGCEWGDRVAHCQVKRIRNDRAARDCPSGCCAPDSPGCPFAAANATSNIGTAAWTAPAN